MPTNLENAENNANEIAAYQANLPAVPQELAKFVLIGMEKLAAVRAEIRAISKLELAEAVYKQKLEEGQTIAEVVLDAKAKLGEYSKKLPKTSGGDRRSENFKMNIDVHFEKSQKKAVKKGGVMISLIHRNFF